MAKTEMTARETAGACHAARLRSSRLLRPTSDKNTGMTPGGSMITNSVMNTVR